MIKKTFYTLVEVAEILDIPVSKLRFYVNRFKIDVAKRVNKFSFSDKNIRKLRKILELVDDEKYRLEGVAGNLRQSEEHEERLDDLLHKLQYIKKTLVILRSNIKG
ncbi:MAG: DNA-binding transcriptional MerR regulator [Spirosomataceae bacterium]|jgi:DNA-binding transcriptional MerR regulator